MKNKRSLILYNFYQGLSERFTNINSLLNHALPVLEDYLGADRVLFFDWQEEKSIISLRTMCKEGKCYDFHAYGSGD